jgi:hypothetical protein
MTALRMAAAAAILLLVHACGAPKPNTHIDAKRGLQFAYPGDWSIEELSEENSLLLMSPTQEGNWQTNVYLEVRTNLDPGQPIVVRLAVLVQNLSKQKKGFSLASSRSFSHASGRPASELVYTHSSQGVPLTERELIVWLPDNRVLFVTSSVLTSLEAKYQGQIDLILESIRFTRK